MSDEQKIRLFDILYEGFFGTSAAPFSDGKKLTFINWVLLTNNTTRLNQLKNLMVDQKTALQTTKDNIPAQSTALSNRIDSDISLIDSISSQI